MYIYTSIYVGIHILYDDDDMMIMYVNILKPYFIYCILTVWIIQPLTTSPIIGNIAHGMVCGRLYAPFTKVGLFIRH